MLGWSSTGPQVPEVRELGLYFVECLAFGAITADRSFGTVFAALAALEKTSLSSGDCRSSSFA